MYSLYRQYLLIVFAVGFLSSILLFNGCKSNKESSSEVRFEKLDSIEAQMFQEPESLDSLIGKVDTTNMTPHEQARMGTIRGLFHFENGVYDQSIKELEKTETYFLNQRDHYHLHICKLIKAFTFEYLDLDHNAASLYVECENYFTTNHLDKFKFYATLGLFRMAKQLKLDEKVLFDRLQKAALQLNDPNFDGLLYATMGVLEKNDSLKSIYYEKAKSELIIGHRWSRVYAIELNTLNVRIRQDHSESTQKYYDRFNDRDYLYTPTVEERMRYKYGQAYLYSKQGKIHQSIELAHQILGEAMALNIPSVETKCIQLLASLYKRISDYKNAHIMLERSHSLQNNDFNVLQQNQMLALGAHYRHSELEREKLELKLRNQKYLLILGMISLIFMFLFLIGWILWKKSKYNQEILKLKNKKIEDQITHLLSSLENQEIKNEKLIRQAEEFKDQYNDSIKIAELLQAIEQKQIKTWMEYERRFRSLRPDLIERLKDHVPELSSTDLKYCICIYLNLDNTVICDLCNVGIDAIKSGKKRIRDKFSLLDAKEIYTFLNDFDLKKR